MGLTSTGFEPKALQDIRNDISANLKIALGNDIDTTPASRIGQFIDVISNEINSVWLGLEDTYNSFYPDSASGISLDNVVAITNTARLRALSSGAGVYLGGDVGTEIAAGSLIQKTGTDERFVLSATQTIVDTSNIIVAAEIPDAGDVTLSWDGEAIVPIEWNDDEAAIKTAVEGHSNIDDVTIAGTLSNAGSFHITFVNESLTSTEVTIDTNTLTRNTEAVDADGYFSIDNVAEFVAVNTGVITVPIRSLTTIATPVVGWDASINYLVGDTGRERETDAELRDRRADELQKAGTSTLNGMRQSIENVANVINVTIVENDTAVIDASGREPHSVECYVSGGDDDEVAQAIYNTKPIGIGIVSTVAVPSQRTGDIIDVNEESQTLTFSNPITVAIELEITGTKDSVFYPDNGDEQIKNALVAYLQTFILGQSVLNHRLYSPVNTVPGLITVNILGAKLGDLLTDQNIEMLTEEVAQLDFSNIVVIVTEAP